MNIGTIIAIHGDYIGLRGEWGSEYRYHYR